MQMFNYYDLGKTYVFSSFDKKRRVFKFQTICEEILFYNW